LDPQVVGSNPTSLAIQPDLAQLHGGIHDFTMLDEREFPVWSFNKKCTQVLDGSGDIADDGDLLLPDGLWMRHLLQRLVDRLVELADNLAPNTHPGAVVDNAFDAPNRVERGLDVIGADVTVEHNGERVNAVSHRVSPSETTT
jgi:hypothetical protein